MARRVTVREANKPVQLPLFPESSSLVRIHPEVNAWRYYRL